MAVYADILIAVNFIVDYFLLRLTAIFLHKNPPLWRMVLAALFAAASALVIFLPPMGTALEAFMRLILSAAITLVAFGFEGLRALIRVSLCFFAVSFGFAGAMLGLWTLFKPQGMVIHNSAVYFDISPLFLIGFSAVGYFASAILKSVFSRNAPLADRCEITLSANRSTITLTAIIDSGNSLEDLFGGEIIIVEREIMDGLFPFEKEESRYRAIPCSGALGAGLLDGMRCDSAVIKYKDEKIKISRPIIAAAKQGLGGDYEAIINPKTLGDV